jgi:hypothetical protein
MTTPPEFLSREARTVEPADGCCSRATLKEKSNDVAAVTDMMSSSAAAVGEGSDSRERRANSEAEEDSRILLTLNPGYALLIGP